jgi:hypothetical protein
MSHLTEHAADATICRAFAARQSQKAPKVKWSIVPYNGGEKI